MKDAQKSTRSTAAARKKSSGGFTADERAAMKDHAQELKTAAQRGTRAAKADGESDVLGKIAEMQEPEARYSTLGFNDPANLDDGTMWPTSYALTELTAADEARIGALVQKAVS